MKVIFDNIIFSLQKSGGISNVWKELLQRILQNKFIDYQIIEFQDSKNNFFRNQLVFNKNLTTKKKQFWFFLVRYFDVHFISKEKYIFHSSYYRLASGKNVINVTTVHDFTYEHFFKGFSQMLHTWQKKRAILKSDGIICISESTKRDLLSFIPQIQQKKIRVIYNGVDEKFSKIDINIPFVKNHTFDDFEYVIYVGDHKSKYKNFEMAVRACCIQKIKLLIIGGGQLTNKEICFLNNSIGFGNYKLLLNVSVEDLNQYYNRAFCLLYPSVYEGFGLPVVEAQRAGCPVIATYSSSIPEVIADLFFAIKNPTPEKIVKKMHYLKLDSEIRNNTIKLGLEKSFLFNWNKTYEKTMDFYTDLYNNLK